jgi:PAS domain S-box-containing protein
MSDRNVRPTGRESPFEEHEIIVTKTDLKGRLTYANEVFLRVSRLTLKEAIGAPHSLIRHPDMPRCVFKLLWDTIQAKQEIFAYVVNMASNGDHYWVLAHVTPTFGPEGEIIGYHSNRRKPEAKALAEIIPFYRGLREQEERHANRKDGMQRAHEQLLSNLSAKGVGYDEFVLAL